MVPDLPASGKVMDQPYCKGLLSSLALGGCLDERKGERRVGGFWRAVVVYVCLVMGSCAGVDLSWEGR